MFQRFVEEAEALLGRMMDAMFEINTNEETQIDIQNNREEPARDRGDR